VPTSWLRREDEMQTAVACPIVKASSPHTNVCCPLDNLYVLCSLLPLRRSFPSPPRQFNPPPFSIFQTQTLPQTKTNTPSPLLPKAATQEQIPKSHWWLCRPARAHTVLPVWFAYNPFKSFFAGMGYLDFTLTILPCVL
jgi:hypothetical protein